MIIRAASSPVSDRTGTIGASAPPLMGFGSPFERSFSVTWASGMVSAQARCTPEAAIALMQSRADELHLALEQVADAVAERTIRFYD